MLNIHTNTYTVQYSTVQYSTVQYSTGHTHTHFLSPIIIIIKSIPHEPAYITSRPKPRKTPHRLFTPNLACDRWKLRPAASGLDARAIKPSGCPSMPGRMQRMLCYANAMPCTHRRSPATRRTSPTSSRTTSIPAPMPYIHN